MKQLPYTMIDIVNWWHNLPKLRNSYMFKNRFRQSMVRSIWCGQSCFAFGIIISIDKSWFRERNGNNWIRNCDDTDLASPPPDNGAIWPLFTHSVCLFEVVQIGFKYENASVMMHSDTINKALFWEMFLSKQCTSKILDLQKRTLANDMIVGGVEIKLSDRMD